MSLIREATEITETNVNTPINDSLFIRGGVGMWDMQCGWN